MSQDFDPPRRAEAATSRKAIASLILGILSLELLGVRVNGLGFHA